MKLVNQLSIRDGVKYRNYYLIWRYEGKFYSVRVKPCFNNDYNKLFVNADIVPENEPLEKYCE